MDRRDRPRTDRGATRGAARRATWRSVAAGFLLIALIFAATVAASHPAGTALALSTGVGLYGLLVLLHRSTVERTLQVCGPRFCLRLQLRVG